MAERPQSEIFWFCKFCPLHEDCTEQSWARAKVWDYDEEGCRQRMKEHLVNSSHHLLPEDEAQDIADRTELDHSTWPVTKKQRKNVQVENDEDIGSVVPRTPPVKHHDRVRQPTARAIEAAVAGLRNEFDHKLATASSSASAAASAPLQQYIAAGSAALLQPAPPPTPPLTTIQQHRGDSVVVSATMVKATLDALERANVAARHAQRLCNAAATAFSHEAEVINEATAILKQNLQP
jgi:hypothetical protein